HTHKWSVYVKGANGEDISNVVEKVVIRLHESFAKPERTFTEPPYSVQETGWGEFEIGIKLYFKHQQHPISMIHMLQLYPKDGTTATEVISEHYDEIVFANPNPSLYDILVSTP
ncbi:yeats family-domain-containing protein, partial [Globomyces pollinis-pini]